MNFQVKSVDFDLQKPQKKNSQVNVLPCMILDLRLAFQLTQMSVPTH